MANKMVTVAECFVDTDYKFHEHFVHRDVSGWMDECWTKLYKLDGTPIPCDFDQWAFDDEPREHFDFNSYCPNSWKEKLENYALKKGIIDREIFEDICKTFNLK